MIYNFKDTYDKMLIGIYAQTEKEAWDFLCDEYGTGYVFENIQLVNTVEVD